MKSIQHQANTEVRRLFVLFCMIRLSFSNSLAARPSLPIAKAALQVILHWQIGLSSYSTAQQLVKKQPG
jgi:hypothetical protein